MPEPLQPSEARTFQRASIEAEILSDLSGAIARRPAEDRPFVVVSYAQSLDGCLSHRQGMPYRLSGDAAMRLTHGVRSRCDGLLVGIGTVIADDPRLTTRHGFGGDPDPIILDSRLRFPLTSKLLHQDKKPLIATLACPEHALPDRARRKAALEDAGATVWTFEQGPDRRIPLQQLLTRLGREGHQQSIMVEGGAKVIAEFLNSGICDYLIVTVAPVFLANQNAVSLALNGATHLPTIADLRHSKVGDDLVVWGVPQFDPLR